jgi:hypothetical protein
MKCGGTKRETSERFGDTVMKHLLESGDWQKNALELLNVDACSFPVAQRVYTLMCRVRPNFDAQLREISEDINSGHSDAYKELVAACVICFHHGNMIMLATAADRAKKLQAKAKRGGGAAA